MNLGELRDELRDLGFEEDSTMTEYNDIFLHAVNRATWLVYDMVVIRLKGYYKRTLSIVTEVLTVMSLDKKNDTTTITVTTTVTKGDDEPIITVEETTRPTETGDVARTISDVTTTEEWYPERPEVLDESSDDSTTIGLPDNTLRITALLAAYYLWLDDDETKAVYYYNMFETFMNALISSCEANVTGKVITMGWGW